MDTPAIDLEEMARVLSIEEPLSPPFDTWVSALTKLSLDDPAWKQLPAALAHLMAALYRRDRLRREAQEPAEVVAQRMLLDEQLQKLRALPRDILEFFGIEHCRDWKAAQVLPAELEETRESVIQLKDTLTEYRRLQKRQPRSLADQLSQRSQMEWQEAQFNLVFPLLTEAFGNEAAAATQATTVLGELDEFDLNMGVISVYHQVQIVEKALEELQKKQADASVVNRATDSIAEAEEDIDDAAARFVDRREDELKVATEDSADGDSETLAEDGGHEAVSDATTPAKEEDTPAASAKPVGSPDDNGASILAPEEASIEAPVKLDEALDESSVEATSDSGTAIDIAAAINPLDDTVGEAEEAVNEAALPEKDAEPHSGEAAPDAKVSEADKKNGQQEAPAGETTAVEEAAEPRRQEEVAAAELVEEIDASEPEDVAAPEEQITAGRTTEDWVSIFWELIGNGDVAGAYWLARSLAAQEEPVEMPLPEGLIETIQGVWWLPSTRNALVKELYERALAHGPAEAPNEQFAAIAAGLPAALLAPATSLSGWLVTDPRLPRTFNQIVTAIKTYNRHSLPVYRDDVLLIRGEDRRQERVDGLVEQAQRWITEAPLRKTLLRRATNVWLAWTRPGGPLRDMIEVVARNRPSDAKVLEDAIEEWRELSTQDRIDRTDADLVGTSRHKLRAITGSPRERLLTQAEEAVELAEEWLETVLSASDQSGWRLAQVAKLVDEIEATKDQAAHELASAEETSSGQIAPGAIRLLRWALQDVCDLLELELPDTKLPSRRQRNFPRGVAPSLSAGLAYRLYSLPEVDISDKPGQPWTGLGAIASALATSGRTLPEAFSAWLEREDYRFTPVILQNLPNGTDTDTLIEKHQQAQLRSQAILDSQVKATQDAVEQAMVDGIIGDVEHAELDSELQSIDKQRQSQNFGALRSQLDAIRKQIDRYRQAHLAHQRERWEIIAQRLEENNISAETQAQITEFMTYVLDERKDIVVVDERLARLEELLDTGALPPVDEFEIQVERDTYQEFVAAINGWENQAHRIILPKIARNLRQGEGRYDDILSFTDRLPRPRELEVADAFQSWSDLKTVPAGERRRVTEKITAILRYLGFTFTLPAPRAFDWKENGKDWIYVSVAVSTGNQSPIPQYGSSQPQTFGVICLWERPGAEVIGSRLHDLKLSYNNVIVLYLGRLMTRQRVNLMHHAREQGLSLAVLDELLLLYLAGERDSRLRTFLRCALPLANLNPYMETGPVPPEMFYGRVAERKSLQQPTGYALVYGGRQLGKSALLQQVEREFHSPDNERYVLREDIKSIGDPISNQEDPELIWQRLRSGLEGLGLIERTTASKPETIISRIRAMMEKDPQRHVLVLFDEADNFLAADIKRNFEIVSQLKALMDDTQRRFKVIFAGLHNVQRYEGIPNQPLAHLPRLAVGPLEPQSAQQLIRQPLDALGFRFPEGDDTPVLSILAYTNYHPGLIQLFCQKLLQMMYQKRPRDLGPFIITRDDVEAVYRQREVQDDIRRRFEWTLALDPRYKALTQMIVLDQIQDRDGYSKTYSLDDLLSLGRALWSQAFQNSTRDEFRGYLDEMAGLGVLVRNEQDAYRLRSPNLVRLMGSEDDIYGALQEVTTRILHPTLVPDSHRAPLDSKGQRYSPFTYQQARVLNNKRHGTGLIFGSRALGIDMVAETIKAHFVPSGSSGKVVQIRVASQSPEAFTRRLRQVVDKNEGVERLIIYYIADGLSDATAEQALAAIDFCQRLRRQRQWVRVLFIFDSVASRGWTSLPRELREDIEEQADVTLALRRWDEIGVAQRLKQQDKIDSERAVNYIIETTQGWPKLFDQLADSWGKNDDVLPACEALHHQLNQADSPLIDRFLGATGWAIDEHVKHALMVIGQEDLFPEEMLVPALLGDQLSEHETEGIVNYLHRTELIRRKGTDVFVEPLVKRLILGQ